MKAEALGRSIVRLITAQIPVFVWGSPGIGKSSIIREIAVAQGLACIDLRLSLLDPTDLKGIPFFDQQENEAVWAAPSFLPKDPESRGILFLDEINTAPPSVQASAYQLVLDRKVGEYTLPEGWSIVAAGNHESDRGVIYRMPPPLANRFVHLELEVELGAWKGWAYRNGIESSVIAFLQYAPEWLFVFEPAANHKSFPTPRSWEYVSRILAADIERTLLLENLSGAVGAEAAVAFMAFRKVMERLPDIDALLRGEPVEVAHDQQLLFALSAGIVSRLGQTEGIAAIDHALRFSMTLPKEFSIMLVKDMQQHGIAVEASVVWEQWVEAFAYLLE